MPIFILILISDILIIAILDVFKCVTLKDASCFINSLSLNKPINFVKKEKYADFGYDV